MDDESAMTNRVHVNTYGATAPRELSRRHVFIGGAAMAIAASGFGVEKNTMAAQNEATPAAESANENVALIQSYYEAYAQGDPEALRPFLAEDIVWRIPGQHPLAGDKHGADEVLAFFTQLAKAGFQAETIVLASGGDWVIDLHRGFSTKGDGALDITWALAFRIADGRIAEAVNFAYDQAAANGYFWTNFPLKPLPDRLAEG